MLTIIVLRNLAPIFGHRYLDSDRDVIVPLLEELFDRTTGDKYKLRVGLGLGRTGEEMGCTGRFLS